LSRDAGLSQCFYAARFTIARRLAGRRTSAFAQKERSRSSRSDARFAADPVLVAHDCFESGGGGSGSQASERHRARA